MAEFLGDPQIFDINGTPWENTPEATTFMGSADETGAPAPAPAPAPASTITPPPPILSSTPSNINTARTAARNEAAKYIGRAGIAGKYENMEASQRELSEKNKASRDDNQLYDIFARAGGQGALSNIGRAAADMRAGNRMQNQLDLSREQGIKRAGITADMSVAKAATISGDRAATVSQAEAARLSREAVAKFNAESKASIAEVQNAIKKESNDIKREANVGRAFDRSARLLAKIEQDIAKLIQNTITFKGKVTENERKDIIKNARLAFLPNIVAVQAEQDRLALELGMRKLPLDKWGSTVTTKNKPKLK